MPTTFSSRFPDLTEPTDIELLAATRAGDERAFGELWTRHLAIGITIARRVTNDIDAHDLVSEAFCRVLQAIRNGAGPTDQFRGYLAASIRSVAATWARASRPMVDLDSIPEPAFDDDRLTAIDDHDDHARVVAAFRALPERWQTALWQSTVKERSNAEIAEEMGIKTTAVAMLTLRARAGLRKEWAALSAESIAV
ncbi:MAG: sigma-70 family RNA polymerase sigma factor [Microbacterium sp.]|nr:sigma-70 family RNA polymerase sigma factor [Microbacterium sp.]